MRGKPENQKAREPEDLATLMVINELWTVIRMPLFELERKIDLKLKGHIFRRRKLRREIALMIREDVGMICEKIASLYTLESRSR